MRITLMNAVSLDGFIACLDGDSDWVVDDAVFDSMVENYDCVLVGRTTYEQFEGDIYPLPGTVNIVLVSDAKDFVEDESDNLHFIGGEAKNIVQQLNEWGLQSALLVGGAKTNERFAIAGLIDDVTIDVHPVLLGGGKPLLGEYTGGLELEDVKTKQYEGFTQIIARVAKS